MRRNLVPYLATKKSPPRRQSADSSRPLSEASPPGRPGFAVEASRSPWSSRAGALLQPCGLRDAAAGTFLPVSTRGPAGVCADFVELRADRHEPCVRPASEHARRDFFACGPLRGAQGAILAQPQPDGGHVQRRPTSCRRAATVTDIRLSPRGSGPQQGHIGKHRQGWRTQMPRRLVTRRRLLLQILQ